MAEGNNIIRNNTGVQEEATGKLESILNLMKKNTNKIDGQESCWSQLVLAYESQFCSSLLNFMFSDSISMVLNQPQWGYLHHRNVHMLYARDIFPPRSLDIKHKPACPG
jgi:hypothetical protein